MTSTRVLVVATRSPENSLLEIPKLILVTRIPRLRESVYRGVRGPESRETGNGTVKRTRSNA
jgi:hypothetical protein